MASSIGLERGSDIIIPVFLLIERDPLLRIMRSRTSRKQIRHLLSQEYGHNRIVMTAPKSLSAKTKHISGRSSDSGAKCWASTLSSYIPEFAYSDGFPLYQSMSFSLLIKRCLGLYPMSLSFSNTAARQFRSFTGFPFKHASIKPLSKHISRDCQG